MPHYSDGTEAHVGDFVVGTLYNTSGRRAGAIVSISPGQDTCNAMVAFCEAVPIDGDPVDRWRELARVWQSGDPLQAKVPRMAVWSEDRFGALCPRFRVVLGEAHGSKGSAFALFECADYSAVRDLSKVA